MSGSNDKIRILALHGSGMNSRVFEATTAALRNELGEGADHNPDLKGFFPEDDEYFTFADPNDKASVAAALDNIFEYIDLNGPFEIIGASSISAGIAADILLAQPEKRAPFTGAIFFNGWTPVLNAKTHNMLISIPTANIWGANDARHAAAAQALSKLCTPEMNENVVHENGSTIPGAASEEDLIKASQAIRRMVRRAVPAC
ncbi:serine hydrolase FSH protein [Rutstroemia sp. NJR-2017a WRK4]|nr:serine hydrolase FSH protein [Rutstroemia sp. NJR-2017a WRK4]